MICILFHPAALSAFTSESYDDLISTDDIFGIFKTTDDFIMEQLFEENDLFKRTDKLERLLLHNLNDQQPAKIKETFLSYRNGDNHRISIENLAKDLDISTPTLFRLFKK